MGKSFQEMLEDVKTKHHNKLSNGIGHWKVDKNGSIYCTHPDSGEYWTNIERLQDSGAILDFIAQVSQKQWASPAIIGELVLIIDEVISLQGSVCGNGVNKKLTGKDLKSILDDCAQYGSPVRDDDGEAA